MKSSFDKPSFEVIHFTSDVIVTSACGCYYEEVGIDYGTDETCVGANIKCTCDPNYDDPSQNCV